VSSLVEHLVNCCDWPNFLISNLDWVVRQQLNSLICNMKILARLWFLDFGVSNMEPVKFLIVRVGL